MSMKKTIYCLLRTAQILLEAIIAQLVADFVGKPEMLVHLMHIHVGTNGSSCNKCTRVDESRFFTLSSTHACSRKTCSMTVFLPIGNSYLMVHHRIHTGEKLP